MTVRAPKANGPNRPVPTRRLTGALKVGTVTANTVVLYQVVPVLGSSKITVRAKCTGAGTLDLLFAGPDFDPDQTVAFASLVGTKSLLPAVTQVVVSANTEALITAPLSGENYVIIKWTGTAAGAINYVDVSLLNS